MEVLIDDERPGDVPVIREVTRIAFEGQPYASGREAGIVDGLRDAGALAFSLVARSSGRVLGHLAVSPVEASSGEDGWYGIGPVSVLPACQRQGIGSKLMHEAIGRLRERGARGCVLVGHPGYYQRFGFRADGRAVVEGVPSEVTFCLAFRGCADPGRVRFHPSFGAP